MFGKNFVSHKNIKFTNVFENNFYPPEPAFKHLPQWYKDTPDYTKGEKQFVNGETPHTVRKCMPVFDAITAGYILFTQVDIEIGINKESNDKYYSWPSQDAISFHDISQAPLHPGQNGLPYPKWMNPWIIETDPGYSCLFINPLHNPNGIFTILPGIVDTDKYVSRINFPFVLNNPEWSGIIPAGTPMVQVIPFKRDSWQHSIGGKDEIMNDALISQKLRTHIYHAYKKLFWSKKEYR